MPRLFNIQIPDEKRVIIGLTYIKGIGISRSRSICAQLDIDTKTTYMKDLTKNQLAFLISYIQKYFKIGQKVKSDQITNIKQLIKISSYRGLRHFKGLPLRGQRTKTNSKNARKNRLKY